MAFLHTTTAYQTAALQLMVGEANFTAKQLDLKEPLPIVIPADTNKWEVMPPPMGVGGMILTSNFDFEFGGGIFDRHQQKGLAEESFSASHKYARIGESAFTA